MRATTGGLFNLPWLTESEAADEAARISHGFSLRFRHAETMVVQGSGGFLTLQGNTPVGRNLTWDDLNLVVVARYAFGRKIA